MGGPPEGHARRGTDGELVAAARADFASVLFSEEMANDARTNEQ
jgi:hypothetical protein